MRRKPKEYPTLTLAQAVTWLACGRYFSRHVIRRLKEMRSKRIERGVATADDLRSGDRSGYLTLPHPLRQSLDEAEQRLVPWLKGGQLRARGFLKTEKEEEAGFRSQVPLDFLQDGVELEASTDSIIPDLMNDDLFGKPLRTFRRVVVDAQEVETIAAIGRFALIPRRLVATGSSIIPNAICGQSWTLVQTLGWVLLREPDFVVEMSDEGRHASEKKTLTNVYLEAAERADLSARTIDPDGLTHVNAGYAYEQAQIQLRHALTRGKIEAVGLENGLGNPKVVPNTMWPLLKFGDDLPPKGTFAGPIDPLTPGASRWFDLRFSGDVALQLWPPRQPRHSLDDNEVQKAPNPLANKKNDTTSHGDPVKAGQENSASVPRNSANSTRSNRRDPDEVAQRHERYRAVLTEARQRWPKGNFPHLREMAAELAKTRPGGFKEDTIRQILRGTYPPMKRDGIPGLIGG